MAASTDSVDRAALEEEIKALLASTGPARQAAEARAAERGRAFDALGWLTGTPDSGKYPTGPAYIPMGVSPSFSACVRLMSLGDVAWTASAGAVFYGVGFSHARQLGVRSAHSLGVWSALPAVVVGVLAGANKGFYRYLGFMDNGNAALYPGYVEDGAPYYLKHKVSDRRADAAPGSTTVPSGGALR